MSWLKTWMCSAVIAETPRSWFLSRISVIGLEIVFCCLVVFILKPISVSGNQGGIH